MNTQNPHFEFFNQYYFMRRRKKENYIVETTEDAPEIHLPEFIIAIDPATISGVAYGPTAGALRWETWNLALGRRYKVGMELDMLRIGNLRRYLDGIFPAKDEFPHVDIVCEGSFGFVRGMAAVKVANELRGAIKAFAAEKGAQYHEYAPTVVKKFATGDGNANKDAVKRFMRGRGYAVETYDEADATALFLLHKNRIGKFNFKQRIL